MALPLIYSSSRGGTIPYLPTLGLCQVTLRDEAPPGHIGRDVVYESGHLQEWLNLGQPDEAATDIWKFAVDGSPSENVRRGICVTQQTGQVSLPQAVPRQRGCVFCRQRRTCNLWVVNNRSGGYARSRTSTIRTWPGRPAVVARATLSLFVSSRGNQDWRVAGGFVWK